MRRPEIALGALRGMRRAILWWSLGLAAMVALEVSVYPTVRDTAGFAEAIENYPEALKDIFDFGGAGFDYTSPAGYLGIEVFSFVVPLLLIIAAIVNGAGAIAGERERGTLELVLSLPVSRRRLVGERLLALIAEVAILAVVLQAALMIGTRAAEMDISSGHLAATVLAAALMAIGFGTIALALGAALGGRGAAAGVTAALAVAAYLIDSLSRLVSSLEPLRPLTPFHHYQSPDPLRNGVSLLHTGVLVGVIVVAAIAALVIAERRDIAG